MDESPTTAVGEATVAADGAASAIVEAAVAADGVGVAAEINVLMAPVGSGDSPCPLEDEYDEDGSNRDNTVLSVTTFRHGDSVIGESSCDEDGAAVAVEKDKRSKRQPRDITPAQQRLQSRWRARNDADHVATLGG